MYALCRRHCRRRRADHMVSVPLYVEGLAIGVCPLYAEGLAVGVCLARAAQTAIERMLRATLRQGRGHRHSSGRHLDLMWAHSATPRVGRGHRHRHHTPRASAMLMANMSPSRAVYIIELRRGLPLA
jgi:hypothetical protein